MSTQHSRIELGRLKRDRARYEDEAVRGQFLGLALVAIGGAVLFWAGETYELPRPGKGSDGMVVVLLAVIAVVFVVWGILYESGCDAEDFAEALREEIERV